MRTLCDVCESAAAILFCAADEAALCSSCDDKVHMCNKLASRHVRVGLAEPSAVPRCDICENAPGMQFPGDKSSRLDEPGSQQGDLGEAKRESIEPSNFKRKENQQNHMASLIPMLGNNSTPDGKMENKLIDLNARPQRMRGQAPNDQEQVDTLIGNHHEDASLVPNGYFKSEPEN
ncbi:B-box zinc finger protein 19-like isoform X2 [Olea europaea var. sylvestris]|uniref:B-box zinc finger protein 19-like isoform X2 n=1 Tax=Olea europaea var. sylvestris TaxID=158386 RepID=UPI000C1D3FC7|nr:B-box zinc finger protein 19-like isoform X2 [Olea europaea var. sylvestris]